MPLPERLRLLESRLADLQVDAIALNAGANLNYLTGLSFHLMERPVLFIHRPGTVPLLVLPALEMAKLVDLPFDLEPFAYGDDPDQWRSVFTKALASRNLGQARIGVEPQHLRLLEYNFLRAVIEESCFIDATAAFAAIRSVKDAAEIAAMEHAVRIAEEALIATLPLIAAGMTEKDCAAELVMQLLRHGSQPELPFQPIVATGPNGANPHAHPSDRRLAEGDLLVIDWGARWNDYASDLTRTFAIGRISEEARTIHHVVQLANEAGRLAGHPGSPCSDIDRAARSVIEGAGYGRQFSHRTGHGIGRECHETPYIHGTNRQLLEPGMTYTVEPGIYLPGSNGVRIEDDMIITDTGSRSLSSLSRELITIG